MTILNIGWFNYWIHFTTKGLIRLIIILEIVLHLKKHGYSQLSKKWRTWCKAHLVNRRRLAL